MRWSGSSPRGTRWSSSRGSRRSSGRLCAHRHSRVRLLSPRRNSGTRAPSRAASTLYVLMDEQRSRRAEPGAAAGRGGGSRAGLHPRGRRLGQDDDDHPPDREPGRDRRVSPRAGPCSDLHRQGRRRDARAARSARRRARARSDVPRRRARAALVLREGAEPEDPLVEGAAAARDRQLAADAVQVHGCGRSCDRGRVGEEPPVDARDVPRRPRRARAADPPELCSACSETTSDARKSAARSLRGSARQCCRSVRAGARRAGCRPGALSGVHRRRVPGREPASAVAARALAWRARRRLRGGDDYQAIYAFTGATPRHLLELPDRYPHATVVRLEANYRSTPEVLALANRLVPKLGGASKTLRAVREGAPSRSRDRLRRWPTSSSSSSSGFARCTATVSRTTRWPSSIG